MGKTVEAGTATITTADILSASDSPSQIVIFRNNEIWITELVDMEVIGDAEDWIIPLE